MKEIRQKVCELLNRHCEFCEKTKGLNEYESSQHCRTQCETGKEIAQLGAILAGGETQGGYKHKRINDGNADKSTYIELKKKGKTDREVMNLLNIGSTRLRNYKKEWGLDDGVCKKFRSPKGRANYWNQYTG